jgi:MFS family permease
MVNRVIRLLVMSDFVINFAFGLLAPIFAVFILKNIAGSTLQVIGLAATFYWVARVFSTVPLSKLMDRTDGEKDEFWFIIIGSFLMASVPLFYLLVRTPLHLYIVQFLYGIAGSMAVPAWRILFVDHIDRSRMGYEWSLEDIAIGCSTAISAYLGSILAEKFGFQVVLILLAMLGYIGSALLIPIYREAKSLAQIKRENQLDKLLLKRQAMANQEKIKE